MRRRSPRSSPTRIGLPIERITVLEGDTDVVPRGTGTYGSKSTQIGGAAAGKASEALVERAKELAANELEANPEDMVLDLERGRFHVAGAPEPGLAWADLATRLDEDGRIDELSVEADFEPVQPTFPFGAHLAVVEVDTETGSTHLRRMIAVDDAGTLINPLVAEGQVHGGLAAGIAQALFEELRYDEQGNPQKREPGHILHACSDRAPDVRGCRDADADPDQPARRQGDRRVGNDRRHAGGAERGDRCRVASGRSPHRHARERPAGVGGVAGRGSRLVSAAAFSTVSARVSNWSSAGRSMIVDIDVRAITLG